MPKKVGFKVLVSSGADENHPAVELEDQNPNAKGWQSQRFCSFPQELVLQLGCKARLRKIQLLSHQFKIATKIELFVLNPTIDDDMHVRGMFG